MGNIFLGDQPDFVVLGMDSLEFDKMMEWAFGEKWQDVAKSNVAAVWNSRHRELYVIHPRDGIGRTFFMIKREWDRFTNKVKIA